MVDVRKLKHEDGTYFGYYNDDGTFIYHNEGDDPAVISSLGTKYWYKHDFLHREDGPAVIASDGDVGWWFKHCPVTTEVEKWLEERDINDYEKMSDEDRLALTFFMRSLYNG